MKKLIIVHFLFIHILPFLIVTDNFYQLLPLFLVWFPFLLGINLPSKKKLIPKNFTYSAVYVKNSTIILLFIFYFLFKSQYIIETFMALVNGEIAQLAIDRVVLRYSGDQVVPVWINLGTIIYFTLSFSIGTQIGKDKKSKYILFLYIIICLIELSSLAKLSVILGILMLIFSYIYNHRFYLDNISYVKIFSYYFFSIMFSFLFLFLLAYSRVYNETNPVDIVLHDKLSLYTIAMYDAFFKWFETYQSVLNYGKNTFSFIWKLLGYSFPQGFYQGIQTNYGFTNIYTIYRNLFSDFPPSIVAVIMLGLGISIRVLSYRIYNPFFFMFGFIAFMLISFVINSVFTFTTFVASQFIIMFIVTIKYKKFNDSKSNFIYYKVPYHENTKQ